MSTRESPKVRKKSKNAWKVQPSMVVVVEGAMCYDMFFSLLIFLSFIIRNIRTDFFATFCFVSISADLSFCVGVPVL